MRGTWYIHPGGYERYLVYTPGWVGPWYTTLVYTYPYTPWVHLAHTVHPAHACRYPVVGTVRDNEALGSNPGIIRE